MVVVGGAAAAAAMGFVKLFQNSHSRDPIAV